MALKIRGGLESERSMYTPELDELVYTRDTYKLYVGNGATVGGVALNVSTSTDPVDPVDPETPTLLSLITTYSTGTEPKTITVTDTQTLTAITVPSHITIIIEPTGRINNTGDVTFNGPFIAGIHKIFLGTSTILFGVGSVPKCYSEWWGAIPNGTTECSVAIQAAFNSNAAEIVFNDGNYLCSAPVAKTLTNGSIKIVGSGNTVIDASGIPDVEIVMEIGGSFSSSYKLLEDAHEGDITIQTNLPVVKGDIIRITSNHSWSDVRPSYSKGELAEVYLVSGTTVTLTSPLCDNYTAFLSGGTGNNATATVSATDGAVTGVNIPVAGVGTDYVNGETVVINTTENTSGAGATGTITASSGKITGITITNGGHNFPNAQLCTLKSSFTIVTKFNAPIVRISDIAIKRNSENQSILGNLGLRIKYAKRVRLTNVHCEYHNHTNISLLQCFDVLALGCSTMGEFYYGLGTSYGLAITSSQRVKVFGGNFYAGRHAISMGGTFPCRDITLDGVTLDNRCRAYIPVDADNDGVDDPPVFPNKSDTSKPHCLDSHSNCQNLKVVNCTINSGAWIGGIDVIFHNNTVKARELVLKELIYSGRGAVKFQPGRDGSYLDICNNKIITYGNTVSANHGIYIAADAHGYVTIDSVTINNNRCNVSRGNGIYFVSLLDPREKFTINNLTINDNVVSVFGSSQHAIAFYGQSDGLVINNLNMDNGEYKSNNGYSFYCRDVATTINKISCKDIEFSTKKANGTVLYSKRGNIVYITNCGFTGSSNGSGVYYDNSGGVCKIYDNTFNNLTNSVSTGSVSPTFKIRDNIDNSTSKISANVVYTS